MRILVLICSCHKHRDRRDAVRATWLRRLSAEMPYIFYVGRGDSQLEADVTQLDVGDSYEELPAKSREVYRYVCDHYQFEWAVKVDDDSYLVPERLPGLIASAQSDYIGSDMGRESHYATGGAGLILSRRLAELIAAQPVPPNNPPSPDGEDGWIGLVVRREKRIKLWWSPRLHHENKLRPSKMNDLVTSHWMSPEDMRKVYADLYV